MLVGGPRQADRRRGDLRAGAGEELQRQSEPAALAAEHRVRADADAVEVQRPGVRGAQADLALLRAARRPGASPSTTNAVIPAAPSSASSVAKTT